MTEQVQPRWRGINHLALVTPDGQVMRRVELSSPEQEWAFRLSASPTAPVGWQVRRLSAESWRDRQFECWLGQKVGRAGVVDVVRR